MGHEKETHGGYAQLHRRLEASLGIVTQAEASN